MLEVIAEDEGLKLTGFISPTSVTRSNRREMTFFINGRWVQDIPLNTALTQAYHTMLMVGRYPLAMLFLEVDPAAVDVNVHPAKAEVRFRNQDKIFSFVERSTRKALLAYSPVPSVAPSLWGTRHHEARQVGIDWSIAHDDTSTGFSAGQLSVSSHQSAVSSPPILQPFDPAQGRSPIVNR